MPCVSPPVVTEVLYGKRDQIMIINHSERRGRETDRETVEEQGVES